MTRGQDSVRIELVDGEYQFFATCTISVEDELVTAMLIFTTKILTSNYCNLVVKNNQILLGLDRCSDNLYLARLAIL
jgi:hypothetical protein